MANAITYEGRRRELAHRASNEIEVTLFWDPAKNEILVEVIDHAAGRAFELAVPPECALDAFHHPYAYRSGTHCVLRDASRLLRHSTRARSS
jgi:hypothetical protein